MADERIVPALKLGEWLEVLDALAKAPFEPREGWPTPARNLAASGYFDQIGPDAAANAELIAMNNAALPDADPRKITREWVQSLREAADAIHPAAAISIREIAAALESYLPPVRIPEALVLPEGWSAEVRTGYLVLAPNPGETVEVRATFGYDDEGNKVFSCEPPQYAALMRQTMGLDSWNAEVHQAAPPFIRSTVARGVRTLDEMRKLAEG